MSRLTETFKLKIDHPGWNYFEVLPKITLANFDNTFSVYFGFLWFSGEFMYVKKYWRGGQNE